MDTKTKEKKNAKGKVIEKRITLNSNTGKISIDTVNKLYKQLITKHKKKHIAIVAMAPDGYKTIKNFAFIEDDLKFTVDSYFASHGPEGDAVREKFSFFFNVEFILLY
jgi:hypothetical protein